MATRIPTPIGEKFGRLTVLEEAEPENSNGHVYRAMLCQCECGNHKVIRFTHLRSSSVRSCGCLHRKTATVIGEKFGRLTLIGEAEPYVSPKGSRSVRWLLKCDCGNQKVASPGNVRSGVTASCGCMAREYNEKRRNAQTPVRKQRPVAGNLNSKPTAANKKFKPRAKYGHITYAGIGTPFVKRDGTELETWVLKCDCGKEIQRLAEFVHRNQVTHCGCQTEVVAV